FYLQAGLVEVLPQRWFTAAQYRIGQQWITRAARDPDSRRIFGECFGVGTFLLEEDGCWLAEWLERSFLHPSQISDLEITSVAANFFQIEERQDVRILRLQSADGTNRLTLTCVLALTDAIRKLTDENRPLIIAGNNKFFSAGAELGEIAALDGPT